MIEPALAGMVVDSYGWKMIFYILLVVSAVALVLTAVTFEDVLENEKIPFDLLSFVLCAAAVAASMVLYAFLMALAVLIPVYIQNICGYSATVSGIVMIPGSIAMALTSPVAGKLYDKLGIKKVFLTGSLLMIAGSAGMFFMD